MVPFRISGLVAAAALAALLGACAELEKELTLDALKAPYVPTPDSYVGRMLALAEPGPDDVLYDLGSGDGRIPIDAVEQYKVKKGVGIEIDAKLIALSRQKAEKAGIADRVEFRQADVFKADFSDATIVTLYLLPAMNMELRPRLLNELRPGTRIVAHRFGLGDWKPDKSVVADENAPRPLNWSDDDRHRLMLYVVPAKVEGLWSWSTSTGTRFGLRLDQSFQMLSGAVDIGRGPIAIQSGRVAGTRFSFDVRDREEGREVLVRFEGRVAGDTMAGTVDVNGKVVPFTAKKGS